MKATARLASALRKAADKIDPPSKAKGKPGIVLKPADLSLLDGFNEPKPLVPLPDFDRHRGSGWGNYV